MKPVLRKGKLTTWKDDKGFGFIRSSDGTQDVFLHITALKETNHRPQVGDVICYQLMVDKDGRIHACNAFISKPKSFLEALPSKHFSQSQGYHKTTFYSAFQTIPLATFKRSL